MNRNDKQNLFIKGMKLTFNYINEEFDFKYIINDIGYANNKSFFDKDAQNNAIEFNRDKNNFINLKFGFKNVELPLNENLIIFFMTFFKLNKPKSRTKIFHEKKYNLIIEKKEDKEKDKEKENEIMKGIKNFSFINNFKISNIPSFSIKTEDNKITINTKNYYVKENSFSFTINITDSYGEILKDFTINPKKDKNNFIFHFDIPINIFLSNKSTKSFLKIYHRYMNAITHLSNNNNNANDNNAVNDVNNVNDNYLFQFNYTVIKNIDLGNINMNDYILDLLIKTINFKIVEGEKNYESSIILNGFKLLYKQKKLDIELNDFQVAGNIKSNVILFFLLYNNNNNNNVKKDDNSNKIQKKENDHDNDNDNVEIKNKFNYLKLLKEVLINFNFRLNKFCFSINSKDLQMLININNINIPGIKKENNSIQIEFDNWHCYMKSTLTNNKIKKIIENNEKTLIEYLIDSKKIKGYIKLTNINLILKEIFQIWDHISFLFENNNTKFDYELDIKLKNLTFTSHKFIYTISRLLITNVKEYIIMDKIFYFKIFEFTMFNKEKHKLVYEKEFDAVYDLTIENEYNISIKCNNVDAYFSQLDVSYILLYYNIISLDEEEIIPGYNRYSQNSIRKTQQKSIIKAKINIPKFNLNFCHNENYDIMAKFSIESSLINMDSILFQNDVEQWREISYKILLNKLNLKYFDGKKSEYAILSKRNNQFITDGNTINDEKKENNQIEIIYNNNEYLININQNEVYVTIDVLFSLFYYFRGSFPNQDIFIDSIKQINLIMKEGLKTFKYEVHFNNSLFLLNTSINDKENLYLDIDKFSIVYENKIGDIPFGEYIFDIGQLNAHIISNNNMRKLYFTDKGFLLVNIFYTEKEITIGVSMGSLSINLSYKDLVWFLKLYLLSIKQYEIVQKKREYFLKSLIIVQKEMNIKNKKHRLFDYLFKNNDNIIFSGNLMFMKLDITLIDDSIGSYHPFMNIIFNKISFNLNKTKMIQFIFYFSLYSYNYIACVWEPAIEKTNIEFINKDEIYNEKKINRTEISVDKMLINLSDMAITFTLLSFNNWLTKYEEEKKKYNQCEEVFISKVTNNQIINYTGIELKIIHNNKEIKCPPLGKIELDYINEMNESKKSKHIELLYDKLKFEIPLEKLVTLRHTISNDLLIISENSLSEKRSIIISLYSPIIVINKSIYPLHFNIYVNNKEELFYELKQNSIIGIPLNYINKNTSFNFNLINKDALNNFSSKYVVSKILNFKTDQIYESPIIFKDKILMMKLDHKIRNVRTLTIFTKYNIVNCLPCDISMNVSNKTILIKKSSQSFIDFNFDNQLLASFSMKTNHGIFTTNQINITNLVLKENNDEDNSIKFKNKESNRYFTLLYKIQKNEEENIFIIYAELMFYNNSRLNIEINPNDYQKKNILCLQVEKRVFIMSSKIDFKEEKISFGVDRYISNKILIKDLIEASPYLKVLLINHNENRLSFNVKQRFSYINIINNPNLKINMSSVVFDILDSCRIINLLSTKKFYICDPINRKEHSCIFAPLEIRGFQFFSRGSDIVLGLSVLNLNTKDCQSFIKFRFEIGIFTLTVDDYSFNLEIRRNSSTGCLDIFVIESTIDNSQIILENLSNEGIGIYQQNFEQNTQIILPNQTQILKIYDYYSHKFVLQTETSAYLVSFIIEKKESKTVELNKNIILLIEANGLKTKATFYNIKDFKKLKSNILYYNININIKQVYFSIIKDNEYPDSKLINYRRNELLLIYIFNYGVDLEVEKIEGALNKDFIKLLINLSDLQIYNQESRYGKFPCLFKNRTSPFISFYNEINYYKELRIAKIKNQEIKVSQMELGIDPAFINAIFKFFDNILYRMNITTFNVHKIFLPEKEFFDPRNTINEYSKATILINATELAYPELKIKFELSNIGADEFLKNRMGCSEFYVWIIKGLIGNKHRLDLDEEFLTYKNGGFIQYLKWFYNNYRQKIDSQITKMGLAGFLGHFKNLLSFEDDENNIKGQRLRNPRVFYGKFKYMKEYNKLEESLIRNTFNTNKNILINQYYPIRVIAGKNEFFLFTTIALFNVNISNYQLKCDINYFSIKNTERNNNKVKVNYNQIIDSREFRLIVCENADIAKSVIKCINEEIINNKEYLMDI